MKTPQALTAIRAELEHLYANMDVKPSDQFEGCWRVVITHPKLIGPPERDRDLFYIRLMLKMASIWNRKTVEIDENPRMVIVRWGEPPVRVLGKHVETTTDIFEIPVDGEIRYSPKETS